MKVLIISGNREQMPDPVFPLGASYIMQTLKNAGIESDIYDACFKDDPIGSMIAKIEEYSPDIIGISMRNVDNNSFPKVTNFIGYYSEIIENIRKISKAKIVLGGSGYSIFAEELYEILKPDFGIKGEGEFNFISLIRKIEAGEEVKEKVIFSERIADIDYNYFPLREGFAVDTYYKYSGVINIQTKRGCPFNCTYCTYPLLEGSKYRKRTPSNVVDEIEYWNKLGYEYFFFVDSVFNAPESFASEICRGIIDRKLNIKWSGFFVPKVEDDSFFDLCVKSGLTSVDFGTDAYSDVTLKGHGKHFTKEDITHACKLCRDNKIKFNHSLILGGPGETRETLIETIDNINATLPTSVIAFIGVRVYPGTAVADLVEGGLKDTDPVCYISDGVKDIVYDIVNEKVGGRMEWIIPGLEKGMNLKLFERIRNKGVKGPLWAILDVIHGKFKG